MNYENLECQSCRVMLKAEWQKYRMDGSYGMARVYYAGARMQPQLIGCALAQEPGCPYFGLELQTVEGDEYAET